MTNKEKYTMQERRLAETPVPKLLLYLHRTSIVYY